MRLGLPSEPVLFPSHRYQRRRWLGFVAVAGGCDGAAYPQEMASKYNTGADLNKSVDAAVWS